MSKVEKRIHLRIAVGGIILAIALAAWVLGVGRGAAAGGALP
jgi:hypothetical protein